MVIPCSFHPAGIVSVADAMLFNDGSEIVAVVSLFESGAPLTYVADATFPTDCAPEPPFAAPAADGLSNDDLQPIVRTAIVASIVKP